MTATEALICSEDVRQAPAVPAWPAGGCNALAIQVAGNVLGIFAEGGLRLALGEELRPFAMEPDACDVRMTVGWTSEMNVPCGAPIFDSGGLWSVFRENGGYRFFFTTSALGKTPYKSAWLDAQFRFGRVGLFGPYFDAEGPVYPLEYPLDELVMIHRLARGEGVEIHAVGVVDEAGRGHLFVGHSGAGKSTLARLWLRESSALVLSDDRIILRQRGGRIWMHGTPWHGDAGIASPEAAPLCGAYLIEHGSRPELRALPKGRAVAELLARSFVPHYSAEAMDFTLGFLARVARETPCFVFRFFPDQSAVEAILRGHD
jgi:AAA domain